MDKNSSFKVGAPSRFKSSPRAAFPFFFSFYLLPQALGQSNLNGGLYFIWSKLTMKDNLSFEEEIVLPVVTYKDEMAPKAGLCGLLRMASDYGKELGLDKLALIEGKIIQA